MDEIRLLSSVVTMMTAAFKFATVLIESLKRKKPFPPQPEKVSVHQGEKG